MDQIQSDTEVLGAIKFGGCGSTVIALRAFHPARSAFESHDSGGDDGLRERMEEEHCNEYPLLNDTQMIFLLEKMMPRAGERLFMRKEQR